jgi:hypothetical protein
MSIVGVFCEDIREEKNDVLTLVGLFPDNINYRIEKTSKQGGAADAHQSVWGGRICVYVRANFDPNDPVQEIKLKLILPDNEEIEIGGASPEVISRAKRQAQQKGGPLAGIISRAQLHGLPFRKPGLLRLEATIGAEQRLLAFLNFQEVTDAVTMS